MEIQGGPNHICGKRNEVFAPPADWLVYLAEAGCDAFTIAQLLGHSDVRVTMRYVRAVEDTKRAAVEAITLSARKNAQVLASWEKQPPVPAAVNH